MKRNVVVLVSGLILITSISGCGSTQGVAAPGVIAGGNSFVSPLDGNWKMMDIRCQGNSVMNSSGLGSPALGSNGQLISMTWNIANTSGVINFSKNGCTISQSQAFTYPAAGKITRLQVGLPIQNPPGCAGSSVSPSLDSNPTTPDVFNYILVGNNLTLSEEGNDDCRSLGSSGPIQFLITRQ